MDSYLCDGDGYVRSAQRYLYLSLAFLLLGRDIEEDVAAMDDQIASRFNDEICLLLISQVLNVLSLL